MKSCQSCDRRLVGNLLKNAFRETIVLVSAAPGRAQNGKKARQKEVDGEKGETSFSDLKCRRMTVFDLFMRILKANSSAAKYSTLMAETRRLQMQAIIPSVTSDDCVCLL